MDDIRQRLDSGLTAALFRLRELAGTLRAEPLPRATGDEVDEIQASETREIGFATRHKLVERVKRLSAALERLNDGEYGVCVECAERISQARLDAVPEAQTCVGCQDGIERFARPMGARS